MKGALVTADDPGIDTLPPGDPGPIYRLNVGVLLFERRGRVWLGRRAGLEGAAAWQFPQGGVDAGEALSVAARRELLEETGVRSAVLVARAPGWIAYDFPPHARGTKAFRGFRGQKQAWFAFRFDGEEAEIDLNRHSEAEFDAWRWAALEEAEALVAPFKRESYRQVISAFAPLVGAARG